MISDVLKKIREYKLAEIDHAKAVMPLNEVKARINDIQPTRGFYKALKQNTDNGQFSLIAEIKKASPSKGVIRSDFNPSAFAKAYESGGASCLSVLTDAPSFQGHAADLISARKSCGLPILRKDFLFDIYQVYQARLWGADCVLLIMAAISDEIARKLEETANELAMDVLIETHDEVEIERALNLRSPLIGVNNRNLHNFSVDLNTSERLASYVDKSRLLVSESGINTHEDCRRLNQSGYQCFLIGESLMRQHDLIAATKKILGKLQ